MSEPWMVPPGPRLLSHYARVSGWSYTDGGRDVFPWPPVPGLPAELTLPSPEAEPGQGDGQVCATFFAGVAVRSYPRARWKTPAEVSGDLSTYARLLSWRMAAHLRAGGTVQDAPPEVLWDPIDVLCEVGAAWTRQALHLAPDGAWSAIHGWYTPTRGHVLFGFRLDADRWGLLESNTLEPRQGNNHRGPRWPVWTTTERLIERYSEALMAAPLLPQIPSHLMRPPEGD